MTERQEERIYTVSQVTSRIKTLLESSLPVLWVEGEISNFVHHSSGHMYFTLKDEKSQLPCVMFRSANSRLSFKPESGASVNAWGRIKVYEPSGRYQLYVESMKPAGLGALAAAFEELKRKLAAEGLFDPDKKRPIPRFPRTVAVATSPTGAAVRDIVRVIGSRMPATRVVVVPTPVQGADAPAGIVDAIRSIDAWGGADVAIVGRGGGSLEDLMAFNDESVARAIAGASTPIVSAVGHEIDLTISDLVADVRAATPSNAGELVVPDRGELARALSASRTRLGNAIESRLSSLERSVRACVSAYAFRLPEATVDRLAQRTDELSRRLSAAVAARLSAVRSGLDRLRSELRLADPANVMARGFAAVSALPDLVPVRSASDVSEGSGVRVTVADGSFDCEVVSVAAKSGGGN